MRRASPSADAAGRLKAAMTAAGVSQTRLATATGVNVRTVSRWLRADEAGPTREQAAAIAEALGDPEARSWWRWPDDAAVRPEPAAAPAATGPATGAGRRPLRLLAVAAVVVALAALVTGLTLRAGDDDRDRRAGPTAAPTTTATASATATGAGYRHAVDFRFTGGRTVHDRISLWSEPSTDGGCDISACTPGTKSVGSVRPRQSVVVSCVITGQEIRNGGSGESGFYKDDRWLRVVPADGLDLPGGGPAYLSNIWFARDELPDDLPRC